MGCMISVDHRHGGNGGIQRGGMLQTRGSDVRNNPKDGGLMFMQIGQEWSGGEAESATWRR